MPVTPTEQEKRSPKWQDYMQQVLGHTGERAGIQMFPEGTKTMRHREMDSANRRHSQTIAQQDRALQQDYLKHSEDLALRKWIAEENKKLAWAEFNASMAAEQQTNPLGLSFDDSLSGNSLLMAANAAVNDAISQDLRKALPERQERTYPAPVYYDWGQHT
jgi:hypothetical protein